MFGLRADSIRLGILDCYGCAVGGERMMDYLLVEHKDRCWDCDLMRIEEMHEVPFCGRTGGRVEMDSKPDWCPLRPGYKLYVDVYDVEKHNQEIDDWLTEGSCSTIGEVFTQIWNECVDRMLGENE